YRNVDVSVVAVTALDLQLGQTSLSLVRSHSLGGRMRALAGHVLAHLVDSLLTLGIRMHYDDDAARCLMHQGMIPSEPGNLLVSLRGGYASLIRCEPTTRV